MVSLAIVGMLGTPSNDPSSAGSFGFASCSLNAAARFFAGFEDMADWNYRVWKMLRYYANTEYEYSCPKGLVYLVVNLRRHNPRMMSRLTTERSLHLGRGINV